MPRATSPARERPDLEADLLARIAEAGLPTPIREYPFLPRRRYRADCAWPDARVLCEVEGGIWAGGRHVRGAGYSEDCRKYSLAAIEGWVVVRVTGDMIKDGTAIDLLRRALMATKTPREWLDGILNGEEPACG